MLRVFLSIKKTADAKRNLKVLMIASVLNMSFAIEKILLWQGINLGDGTWACVYGSLALFTTYVATHDYILDTIESDGIQISPTI